MKKKYKQYRYLEIMKFDDHDIRTGLLSSFSEICSDQLSIIIKNYKIYIKLTEKEYNEIFKLLYRRNNE